MLALPHIGGMLMNKPQKKNERRKKEKQGPISLMVEHVQRMITGNISDQYHHSSVTDIVILIVVLIVVFIALKLSDR